MPAPELTDEVDFGLLDPDKGLQSWTRVNKKKSHRECSASPTSPVLNPSTKMNSDSTLPVVQATQGVSPEQLMHLARRYEQLARQASEARSAALLSSESELRTSALLADESHGDTNHHVDGQPAMTDEHVEISDVMLRKIQFAPTKPVDQGEGTSRTKGKGPDPRNWGAIDFSEGISEADVEAQREALANFAEINRVIKQEPEPTPPGFFDDLFPIDISGHERPPPTPVPPTRARGFMCTR
ncbi:hypothetical protein B0H14DRAFT_3424535 [Mycena olivaceomarginata]|nr:hypothetical protein B0H14DRAFT_3424535 [Mycena olivaceomarginata]